MFRFGQKNKDNTVELKVSNQTVIRVLLLTIISFIFLTALQKATNALIIIFTAFFLALALNLPVHWLAVRIPGKRRGNRTLATAMSFFIITAFLIGFLASIVPPLVKQTSNFIDVAPSLVKDVRREDSELGRFIRKYKLEDQTDKYSGELTDRLGNIGGTAVNSFIKITTSLLSTLTILVLTFMMLVEGPRWMAFARRLVPGAKQDHFEQIMKDMYAVITGFVNGQVILAALAAVLMLIPFFAFGISYPIALMAIVFICGLIPMVGHIIGALIISSVALLTSPFAAIGVLAYYIAYQQAENYILQPKIQSNTTNLTPLLVFSSVVIGVSFSGLLGGLVAIPIAGCLKVLVMDYLETRKLLTEPEVKQIAKEI